MTASCALDLPSRAVQNAGTMAGRARSLQVVRVVAALSVAIVIASCATTQKGGGGWFGAPAPTPTPTPSPKPRTAAATAARAPRLYYAGVEGLKVYGEPSASSTVVGTLSLREKVRRVRVERGFAFVESTKSGVKGWVDNAQLAWRLPTAPATAGPAPGEAQPEEVQPEEVQTEEAPPEEPVRASLQSLPNTFVTAIDAVRGESGWAVRADVAAPRVLAPGDVRNVGERTAKAIGEPVELTVRARTDVLVTGRQYQAVGDVPLPEERNGMPTPEARSP